MNIVVTIDQGELDAVVGHLTNQLMNNPDGPWPLELRRAFGTLRAAAYLADQTITTDAAGL